MQLHLIIIDGLDECADSNAQALIVESFVTSIASHREKLSVPLKVLIVSRPETNIDVAFRNPNVSPFVKRLVLNHLWRPSNDIELFLYKSFADIKRLRPSWRALTDWPSDFDIAELVDRSSGQFIYASVVIKFLQSHRKHPVQSLKVILGLMEDTKSRPYAELDALYAHMFSKVDDLPLILRILCISLSPDDFPYWPSPTCYQIEDILELPEGMVTIALNDLVSVISMDNGYIKFHHHSLHEFLWDKARSGNFSVDNKGIFAEIAVRCITFMKNSQCRRKLKHHYLRLNIFPSLADRLNPEDQISICEALSEMDIMSAILPMLITPDPDYADCGVYFEGGALSLFFSWIFKQHASFMEQNMPHILGNAVVNIKEWILRQFKAFPFSGFDQSDGVDLWVFAVGYEGCKIKLAKIAATLAKLMNSDCAEFVNDVSPSVEHCWRILHFLPNHVLSDFDLFGEYAMTDARYLNASLCSFQGILYAHHNKQLRKYLMDNFSQGIGRLLAQTPASKVLFMGMKVALATFSADVEPTPHEEDSMLYYYVVWGFMRNLFKNQLLREIDCQHLANMFYFYMKKTREAIPNSDIIVEEELKAKKSSVNTTHEGTRKTKVSQNSESHLERGEETEMAR